MLGDDEHPISIALQPRFEGGHVVVRAGLRGMRGLAGELTFRPEEWAVFAEVLGASRVPCQRQGGERPALGPMSAPPTRRWCASGRRT